MPTIAAKRPKTAAAQKKSGIRVLAPNEILFNDGETADSLFIIQKGQLRIFKPKGKGYIELAVLRAGEVLGEMAFFDDTTGGGRRSCSASAIIQTEIIEISFQAFGKTMANLNPWFKTIISTLADRLRQTNTKVKELESNNVANFGQGVGYKFFRNIEVIKLLSIFALLAKPQGDDDNSALEKLDTLKLYALDIFNIHQAKLEEFINLLSSLGYIDFLQDAPNQPKIIKISNIKLLKELIFFLNTQRNLPNDKKLHISPKCELFLERIIKQLNAAANPKPVMKAELGPIINEFKSRDVYIDKDDLDEAISAGFLGEILVNNQRLTSLVQIDNLRQQFPAIRIMNAIAKINDEKDPTNQYKK